MLGIPCPFHGPDYHSLWATQRGADQLVIDGQQVKVTDWWACRDHSWGVRNGMAVPEPQTGPKDSLDKRGFMMAFLFFSAPSFSGTLLLSHRQGEPAYVSGELRNVEDDSTLSVLDIALDPILHEGTRRFSEVTIDASLGDGSTLLVHCVQNGNAIAMQGLGYSGGYSDRKGLGFWRGEHVVEQDVWDVSDPAQIVYSNERKPDSRWHRIQPVRLTCTHNNVEMDGYGSLTLVLAGAIPSLGLGV